MKSKILKGIIGTILLSVSPFIVLAVVGSLYVIFQMICGASLLAGVQSFTNFIYSIIPFLGYLTMAPMIIIAVVLLFKNKQRIANILQKR